MNRSFGYINLALLLILGGTCVYQWRQEASYSARITSLEKQTASQLTTLHTQTEDLRRTSDDLQSFKENIATLTRQSDEQTAALREEKARAFALAQEKTRLTEQIAAWQRALESHKAALAKRDENIKTLLEQRDQILAAQRDAVAKANESITAYNELTSKYESVVNRYNTLAAQYQAERENPARAADAK